MSMQPYNNSPYSDSPYSDSPYNSRMSRATGVRRSLGRLWATNAPLTFVGLAMIVLLSVALAGVLFDPRVITGSPAWLKPGKFALSVAIYSLTLVWLLGFVKGRERLVAVVANVTAAAFAAEMLIIVFQVVRGTTSHFNVSSSLDTALWTVMAVAIVVLWLMNLLAAALVTLQRFDNPAWAWSLRLALLVTFIGLGLGFLMTSPTAQQLASWQSGGPVTVVGAHTVGALDGGPGLPVVGWSIQGGDLRVPHFVGMHALQLLPLVGWFISRRRRWPMSSRVAMVVTVALSYLGLVGLVTWQALRAQPLLAPDALTLTALAALGAVTLTALLAFGLGARDAASPVVPGIRKD